MLDSIALFPKNKADCFLQVASQLPNSFKPFMWLLIKTSHFSAWQLYYTSRDNEQILHSNRIDIATIPGLEEILQRSSLYPAENLPKHDLQKIKQILALYQNHKRFNCVSSVEHLLESAGLMNLQVNRQAGKSKKEYSIAMATGGLIASFTGSTALILNKIQKNQVASVILKSYTKILNNPDFFNLPANSALQTITSTHNDSNKYVWFGAACTISLLFAGSYYSIKSSVFGKKVILESQRPLDFFKRIEKAQQIEQSVYKGVSL